MTITALTSEMWTGTYPKTQMKLLFLKFDIDHVIKTTNWVENGDSDLQDLYMTAVVEHQFHIQMWYPEFYPPMRDTKKIC